MERKAYAKLNIFLKIVGLRDNYHELVSRFILYKEIYDIITFEEGEFERFEIVGTPEIRREENIIYKAFCALNSYTHNPKIIDFFFSHRVKITKNIPSGAGLGGGSSDAAIFMHMVNDALGLGLSKDELAKIGANIGADVPFFVYGYEAANVRGIGEKIEPFEDTIPKLTLKISNSHCNTAKVYQTYRSECMESFAIGLANRLASMTAEKILDTIEPIKANDLYCAAMRLCPELAQYSDTWYLSGSGSTLFRRADESCSNK
ncbi:4-(cytidine 5'-diphospho)-2-C-methyl-D-erythritol kinase [Nitratiruptor sp. YY09-18]|uniref:4-(cytidine 5'-diphospho)-2-C-methyl-D-erythritol kinase n=1 Tax=Nitratiruptor sp. YY09-18 TaxID=2724901 RepID=UPI001916994C|nr:4-(cytidine 5'-diphospho)-2-C-methyl-D-erythritol kinase [Nitratiruptor sp. YY09-18]BCD68575.1 4-diphosphocytidyl-2-C-methyl-D-erythritol kinase [Nitratiruptor sp. YY09-18]